MDSSSDNNVTENIASNNGYGIRLNDSSNNTIYNNYFSNINNTYDNGNNTWNTTKTAGTNIVDGPYLGGNYWSDYDGTDLDGDKLGDTLLPYNCSGGIENGGDYHPLIKIPKIILKASKDGYASAKNEIDNDENVERMEISGKVTDKSTGKPIKGAKVEIVKGANPASTTTGADGTYIITAIIPEGSGSDTREDINFELMPSQPELPDLTLTSEDIQFIPPASNSTSSSSSQQEQTTLTKDIYEAKSAPNTIEYVKSARSYKEIVPRGMIKNRVTSSSDAPSFTIENLTYPPTVNPNQTFQVTVDTNYSFNATTYIFAGIWDYDASEYIARTPSNETLSGIGNKSYTFNLTAPSSGIMNLSADLWYSADGWILSDYRDFNVSVTGKENIVTISATIHSIGTADASNVVVQFFDGNPDAGGVQIGSDQTIPYIPAGGTGSAQVSWDITGKTGSHVIYVKIDPYNTIAESDEDNNLASKLFLIQT